LRVAMLSGGKDSLYAAFKSWPVDLGLLLVYEFPRPSPHLVNLGKCVETVLATRIPVVVLKLRKGRERDETVRLLSSLGADEVVAGDVFIEDHLKYMEALAGAAGAKLLEPLWGMNTEELMYRIFEEGFKAVILGAEARLEEWVGRELNTCSVREFVEVAKGLGVDPLGERGEYHTLVVDSPLHERSVKYDVVRREVFNGYVVLKVV